MNEAYVDIIMYDCLLSGFDSSNILILAKDVCHPLYLEQTLITLVKLNLAHSFSHCSTNVIVGTSISAL